MSNYYDKQNVDNQLKKKKPIKKEQFYPNTYPKELMYSMINEFGTMIRNKQYTKYQSNKINKSIKRARFLALWPFCSKHFFKIT